VSTDILFEEKQGRGGSLGIATLNRPAVLNALSLPMIHALHEQLKTWAADANIKGVVIRAVEGRAFCAGGDIRQTYDKMCADDPGMTRFFQDEYQLNSFIFHFPKPYIALLDGITMGGGVGISIHGSHRVGTENLLFAMPETGIGFFPDVGGTYFLPRLPWYVGYYLGLTGARIGSSDCYTIGLTQHHVRQESLAPLLEKLIDTDFGTNANDTVTSVLTQFDLPKSSTSLLEQEQEISHCFNQATVEEVIAALESAAGTVCQRALTDLKKKSPTSLKVTLRALQQGAALDFDQCMQQEFYLAGHFLKGADFREGIRAVIIDKDQQPEWQPASLDQVTDQIVSQYFACY